MPTNKTYENLEKMMFSGVGEYGIPEIMPEQYEPCEWIGFNYAVSTAKASGTFDNSNPKANTKDVTYKIKHGIVSWHDSRGVESYGINWDKVSSVSGQTYNLRGTLKEKGFRWDGKTKSWVKKD